MQDYEVTLKLLFRNSPRVLFQELAGTSINTWLDTELPRVQNLRADLVGDAADGSIVHFELQSTNDPRIAIRMSRYCVDIRDLHGKFPRQFVVYIGKAPISMETQLAGPDFLCRYTVFDLRELDGQKLLASPSLADNVIAILARLRDHKEAVRVIISRIAQLEGESRQDALSQLLIAAGLRNLAAEVCHLKRKVAAD